MSNITPIEMLIKAKIDETTTTLQTQIDKIAQGVQVPLGANLSLDTSALDKTIKGMSDAFAKETVTLNRLGERSFDGVSKSIDEVVQKLSKFGGVSVKNTFDTVTGKLSGFEARVRKSSGEIETLRYQLKMGRYELVNFSQSYEKAMAGEGGIQARIDAEMRIGELSKTASKQSVDSYTNWWRKALHERELREKQLSDKTLASDKKRYDRELEQMQRLMRQAELAQARLLNKPRANQGHVLNIMNELNSLSKAPEHLAASNKRAKELLHNMKLLGIEANGVAVKTNTISGAFRNALIKFPLWMGASTAFYGTIRGIRDAMQNIIAIDSQMTVLRRVMDDTTNFNNILEGTVSISRELGKTIADTLEAATGYARQGFGEQELLHLTRTSQLLSNISELNAEESMSSITAAMTIFNVEAEKSITIVDALNEIDNNFAVTSQILADGLRRAGASAVAFGVTMEEMLGHITAISVATRESGQVVGNSLRTIYSRITTMQPAIDTLAALGISINETVNGIERVRNVQDILAELANKWDTLSDAQKQHTGVQLAGRYQLSRFLVMMQNWEMAVDATSSALNSQGSAARENEKYMESLEARIALLKNSWESLSLTMGEAFLTDSFVGIVSSLEGLINLFNKLTHSFGLLPTALAVLIPLFLRLSKTARASMVTIMTSTRWAEGSMVLVEAAVDDLGRKMGLTGEAARKLGIAMRTAFLSIAATAGFMLVGMGIEWLVSTLVKARKEAESLRKTMETSSASFSKQAKTINDLTKELNELNEVKAAGNLSVAQEERYFELTSQLSELLPSLTQKIDEKGRVHLLTGDALEREINLMRELVQVQQDLEHKTSRANFEKGLQDQISKQKELERVEKRRERNTERLELITTRINEQYAKGLKPRRADLLESERLLTTLNNQGNKIRQLTTELGQLASLENHTLQSTFEYLVAQSGEVEESFARMVSAIIPTLNVAGKSFDELTKEAEDLVQILLTPNLTDTELLKLLTALYNDGEQAEKVLKQLGKQIEHVKMVAEGGIRVVDEFGNELGYLGGKAGLTSEAFINLREDLESTEELVYIADGIVQDLSESYLELSEIIKDQTDDLKTLNKAMQDVNETGYLSSDTALDLITKYPQLASAIIKTADGWEIAEGALESLRQTKILEAENAVKAEIEKTRTTVQNTLERVKAYDIELDAIKSLDDAHREIAKLPWAQGFGDSVFDDTSFDENTLTMTHRGQTTTYSNPETFHRDRQTFEDQQQVQRAAIQIGSLEDSLANLGSLLDTVGTSFGTAADKGRKEREVALKSAQEQLDTTKELIDQYNRQIAVRQRLIGMIEREVELAEGLDKRVEQEAHLNQLLKEQEGALGDITKAQQQITARASELRGASGRDTSGWFGIDNQATKEYTELLNSIAKRSQDVYNSTKLSNEAKNKQLEALAKERQEVELLFTQIQALKNAWDSNTESIYNMQQGIRDTTNAIVDMKFEFSSDWIENQVRLDLLTLQEQIEAWQRVYKNHESDINDSEELRAANARKQEIATKNIDALLKQQQQETLDNLNKERTARENYAKEIVRVYKKALEAQRDAELAGYRASMDIEKSRHEKVISNLEKELSLYEEIIGTQLQMLDRQFETDDYEAELASKRNEQQRIQAEIDRRMLDGSIEGQAKRAELEEELAKITEDIEKFQTERSRKLQREALQDQLEDYRKDVNGKKKAEEEKHKSTMETYDKAVELREEYWDNIINSDRFWMEIERQIVEENVDGISREMTKLQGDISNITEGIRKSLRENLIAELENANNLLNQIRTGNVNVGGTVSANVETNVLEMKRQAHTEYLANKWQWERLLNETGRTNTPQQLEYQKRNEQLRAQWGFRDYTLDDLLNNRIESFGGGGAVGNKDMLALLHKKEYVLNPQNFETILKAISLSTPLVETFRQLISSLPTSSSVSSGGLEKHYNDVTLFKVDSMTIRNESDLKKLNSMLQAQAREMGLEFEF